MSEKWNGGVLLSYTPIKLVIIGALFLACFSFLALPRSSSASFTFTLSVNSAHGLTSGSGFYSSGVPASFSLSQTIVYSSSGTTRYLFEGWSCSGTNCYSGPSPSTTIVITGNVVETATWETEYLLIASTTGNGSVSPSGDNWYAAGSTIDASETASGSWFFACWTLDGQNVGSSQVFPVVMNQPHILVANFIQPKLESELVNVTDPHGNNQRNPDGTFYRSDEFEITYNITETGIATPALTLVVNLTYPSAVLAEIAEGSDHATFRVLASAAFAPYTVNLHAYLLNSVGGSLRPIPIESSQPFAVVEYSPHFVYLAYMDYNCLNTSTYDRPFVILVSYNGNSPGYSYSGNKNTDPFSAFASSRERAIINNFTFSTDGWSIDSKTGIVNNSMSIANYVEHSNLDLSFAPTNKTELPTVMTLSNRVQKYYFLANPKEIKDYVNTGSLIYLNVTVNAWFVTGPDSKSSDFITSYLYEPIFYDGYLIFRPYGGTSNFSVSIVSHNPSPLDSYLLSRASSVFGNESRAINSLKADLYPAYSSTLLEPLVSSPDELVFLLNQTNLATANNDVMPYYTISIFASTGYTVYSYDANNPPHFVSSSTTTYRQAAENITYNVYDHFGLFALQDFPANFPFQYLTGYYFLQPAPGQDLVMQPLNFSFSSSIPYLVRTYGDTGAPFFVSSEPGNLTQSFPMIYGESPFIISPSLAGGGILGLEAKPTPTNGGSSCIVSILIGNQSGGASQVWVKSDRGETLYNSSLPPTSLSTLSLGPSGYAGNYTFEFPVGNTNHSVTIYIKNSWGGTSVITGVALNPSPPQGSSYSPTLPTLIILLAFGLSTGYSFSKSPKRIHDSARQVVVVNVEPPLVLT